MTNHAPLNMDQRIQILTLAINAPNIRASKNNKLYLDIYDEMVEHITQDDIFGQAAKKAPVKKSAE